MNIFVNPEDRRLRAGWRIAVQLILFLLLVVSLMLAKNALIEGSYKILEAVIMGSAGVFSIWVATRMMDRRPTSDFGLAWDKTWKHELGIGLALGAIAMTVIFLVQWVMGWIDVIGFGWERTAPMPYYLWFISYLVAMLIIGFYEELIFRGYQIFNMVEGLHSSKISLRTAAVIAVAISSIIFGLMHAGNPNASFISTFNIVLAGIMLAVPFLMTGRLAISVGIHISWNFIQGGLFGFPVSGTIFRGSLIQIDQEGARFITGGSFGPEAGLLGLFGILLVLLLFLAYFRHQYRLNFIHEIFHNRMSKSAKQDESRS